MYSYKIENIKFCDDTNIQPGALTLIVGPNNSGKTRILRDILTLTTGGAQAHPVVEDLNFMVPADAGELLDAYDITTHTDENNNVFLRSLSSNLNALHSIHVGGKDWTERLNQILSGILEPQHKATFGQWFGNSFVSLLSTEERLKLIKETDSSEKGVAQNLLHALYHDGTKIESKVREIVQLAFKQDIRLDYSTLRKLLFRIGDDLSNIPVDPRDAVPYYEKFDRLDDQGDGIRSFVGTVVTMLVGDRPVLLLDEPEAFLHPPQAFRLGEVVADQSHAKRQVFVATHSSEFLRGVISKRQDVTILRVERSGKSSVIRKLESNGVASFANDPLLSSTRILDGLFYRGAIIVESDADSVFYQRIGRELDDADSFHVVHAHNKQTVAKVLSPYQSLGIRHAAIVDFDIMRVSSEFSALIKQFCFPDEMQKRILELREEIATYIELASPEQLLNNVLIELDNELLQVKSSTISPEAKLSMLLGDLRRIRESGSAWKPYKKEGRARLDPERQAQFDDLWMRCAGHGLFIVPVGELEGWLTQYGLAYTSNKSKWIVHALEMIPTLTADQQKDPWRFLQSVYTYLAK